jgi:hypothetical protein
VVQAVGSESTHCNVREFFQRAYYKESIALLP